MLQTIASSFTGWFSPLIFTYAILKGILVVMGTYMVDLGMYSGIVKMTIVLLGHRRVSCEC